MVNTEISDFIDSFIILPEREPDPEANFNLSPDNISQYYRNIYFFNIHCCLHYICKYM